MINILECLPNVNDATSFYRGRLPMSRLAKKHGKEIQLFFWNGQPLDWSYLCMIDIIFLQRPYDGLHLDLIAQAKQYNIPVWVDFDDYLLGVNTDNRNFDLYQSNLTKETVKRIITSADHVTVSTGYLKDAYLPYNKNITVIPNAVDTNYFTEQTAVHNFISWRGGENHERNLQDFSQQFISVGEANPDWVFYFMGSNPGGITEKVKHNYLPFKDIMEYYHNISHIRPKIHVVPLRDNPFNRSKSNCSWLEMTYAGAVLLAPDWEEFQKPGIVNYTGVADFGVKLQQMVSGEINLAQCNQSSITYIKSNLTLNNVNQKRWSLIRSLVA